ncbi:MAG: signal peptidase I [Anaerolineae bacterium]
MSPAARRYFGCCLPVLLLAFGCGTFALLGYASRVAVQVSGIPDDSMAPLLRPGWTILVNNMAYWTDEPSVGNVVTVGYDGKWALRRVVAVPGETIEVKDGQVIVDGQPRDPGYAPHGEGPDQPPVELGPDMYFVLADDRSAPDSRIWGPVHRDDIYGLAVFQIDNQREFHAVLVTPTPAPDAAP